MPPILSLALTLALATPAGPPAAAAPPVDPAPLTALPPGAPPPTVDAGPGDIILLTPRPGPAPLPDCGPLAWPHHPLDPARTGRHCAAALHPPHGPPILAVARPGEPPVAIIPITLRADAPGALRAIGPPPANLAAIDAALARWAAP